MFRNAEFLKTTSRAPSRFRSLSTWKPAGVLEITALDDRRMDTRTRSGIRMISFRKGGSKTKRNNNIGGQKKEKKRRKVTKPKRGASTNYQYKEFGMTSNPTLQELRWTRDNSQFRLIQTVG